MFCVSSSLCLGLDSDLSFSNFIFLAKVTKLAVSGYNIPIQFDSPITRVVIPHRRQEGFLYNLVIFTSIEL